MKEGLNINIVYKYTDVSIEKINKLKIKSKFLLVFYCNNMIFYLLFLYIFNLNNIVCCKCCPCCNNGNKDEKKYEFKSSLVGKKPLINNDDLINKDKQNNLESNNKDNLQNTDTYNKNNEKYNENQNIIINELSNFINNDLNDFKNKLININKDIEKLSDERLYLINLYIKQNNIENVESIQIEQCINSALRCIKITLNDKIFYIKGCEYANKLLYDLLSCIGLLDYKYYFSLNYVLSEHVDQNIDNEDLNQEIVDMDYNLDTTKLKNMLLKIKNFKEYNFFCSLLGLGDCHLIYRLDNSYFKKEGDKYKVFLLDVDYNDPINLKEGYDKFYDVLNSNTVILKFFDKYFASQGKVFYRHKEISPVLLIALSISLTLYEKENTILNKSYDREYFKEKYSPDNTFQDPEQLINFQLSDKDFINHVNTNKDINYKPKKNYNYSYPINFIDTLKDMYEEFKNKDKSTSEEEKESKFLEYILPLLYTHLGIEKKAKNEEDYEEINTLEKFKDAFLKNYNLNKSTLITINNYYRIQCVLKPELFKELIDVNNFTDEENHEIKSKLIKLVNFIKEHKDEYNTDDIKPIKKNFNFLKTNNMFPQIISGISFE